MYLIALWLQQKNGIKGLLNSTNNQIAMCVMVGRAYLLETRHGGLGHEVVDRNLETRWDTGDFWRREVPQEHQGTLEARVMEWWTVTWNWWESWKRAPGDTESLGYVVLKNNLYTGWDTGDSWRREVTQGHQWTLEAWTMEWWTATWKPDGTLGTQRGNPRPPRDTESLGHGSVGKQSVNPMGHWGLLEKGGISRPPRYTGSLGHGQQSGNSRHWGLL